jgi:AcrR family transcriptional regulator
MTDNELDPKKRILQAAIELLNEQAPESITIRKIAERAGVGIGLINYHFQSKDRLLNEAVGGSMAEATSRWLNANEDEYPDPALRLKNLLKETSTIGARFPVLLQIAVSYELQHGNFSVPQLIVPILREIFGPTKKEKELRLLAFQLVTALQVAAVRADAFEAYSGVNILDEAQRDKAIDLLIESILPKQ